MWQRNTPSWHVQLECLGKLGEACLTACFSVSDKYPNGLVLVVNLHLKGPLMDFWNQLIRDLTTSKVSADVWWLKYRPFPHESCSIHPHTKHRLRNFVTVGRAVAQAVRRWLPTAAARVRVRTACGVCGGQSGTGASFLRVLRLPLQFIPPISPSS
jgi:hypothetical protein